jgi:hypothetical protein
MADDPVAPSNNIPGPIPFGQYTSEDLKILHPNKTIEETSPPRTLPWSKNLGNLNADQIASSRQKWIDSKLDVSVFDAAVRADGGTPPDFEDQKLQRDHGLQTPHANEIKFTHPLAEKHSSELIGFVQAARFQGGLGAAVIDHIAENGNRVASMSSAEKAAWTSDQEKLGITLSGGKAAWDKAKTDAKAFLGRLKTVDAKSGGDLAKNLANSALMGSAFLTCTFATSETYWASYAAAAARKAKSGPKKP